MKIDALWKTVTATAVLISVPAVASADQTINGAIGLPLNPTAQIPDAGSVRVQGNFYDLGRTAAGSNKLYGAYAAGRVGDNLEVSGGLNRLDVSGGSANERSGLTLGVKYLFNRQSESPGGVRIAVGAGYDRALYKNTHAYVVGSAPLSQPGSNRAATMAHLGLRYDRFDNDRLSVGSNTASVFGGVEVPVTADGKLTFVGELQSENTNSQFGSSRFPYSASLRYRQPGRGFSASAGIARQGITNDNGVFVQIGKTF